ncbi:hypothetical protein M0R45_009245 [Rubus argutus]|uniref:DYW domain-containing protein n=1 Tax=Rubus argutus TaxID=59490 RepID=A0AAW1Y3Z7_RUBAR
MSEEEGLKPNEVTVLGALSACSQLGAVRGGEKIHSYIVNAKLDMHVIVCNAVIDMLRNAALWIKHIRCLRYDMWKNLVTWNTMVMAFAMHGDGYKALELFEKMGENGVCPDAVSYLAALCACNHAGLVEDGVKLFYSMASSGMVPNVKHYGTVVDLLGRAGRLQEAYEIVKSMPMFPDVVLWQTLLGASKTYGNVDMAEMASQKLVELGSEGCGDFVLLSNVYAAHKRWDDVGRLDEIKFRIKAYGYVAKTNHVLHDIGEEDKENALSYHFYNREIIVRDRARFHRFKEGFCSCRDYW